MRNNYKLILALLLLGSLSYGQDLHYSQYLSSPLNLNPALTGVSNADLRVISNYRTQWKSVSANPYKTFSISVDGTIPPKKKTNDFFGVGILVNSDHAGASQMSLTSGAFNFSFTKALNPRNGTLLTFGIQAAGCQKSMKYDNLTWDSQYNGQAYDPTRPSLESPIGANLTYFDCSAGVGFNTTLGRDIYLNAGVSLWHINAPSISVSKVAKDPLLRKLELHGAVQIPLAKHPGTSFIPSVVYFQQGPQLLINGGCAIRYRLVEQSKFTGYVSEVALVVGAYYRYRDAAFLNARLDFKGFCFGINYDVNVSGLSVASSNRGGMEFCLMWKKTLLDKSKYNPKTNLKLVQF